VDQAVMRQIAGVLPGIIAYCDLISSILQFPQNFFYTKGRTLMAKARRSVSKGLQIQSKSSKLPLFLALGGAVILIIAAFFAFQKKPTPLTPEVSGGPSLKADKEKVDLGEMKLGSTAQVSFTITNVGDQPLSFSKAPYIEVKEGC
jgi:hypothetical protein